MTRESRARLHRRPPGRVPGKRTASAARLTMRIYEASIAYSIVQLGDVTALNAPEKIAEYLRDAYARNPCQESLWVVCLDRKNKPISRTMVTLGTLTCALAHPREVFKIAILASAAAIVVSHNLCDASHRLCYVARRAMWSWSAKSPRAESEINARSLHIARAWKARSGCPCSRATTTVASSVWGARSRRRRASCVSSPGRSRRRCW